MSQVITPEEAFAPKLVSDSIRNGREVYNRLRSINPECIYIALDALDTAIEMASNKEYRSHELASETCGDCIISADFYSTEFAHKIDDLFKFILNK